MVVQHNLRAMNSNRMLGLTANVQSKSTEKLSSGYKINRAADDAAGLSISEKMRKQIRGLTQASLNAADGISAVQTAEGALNEVQDMLQRMNELSVKAANGTMSEDDRSYIQNEIDQLVDEIDRVSETTKFNETYLLKGAGTETTTEASNLGVSMYDAGAFESVESVLREATGNKIEGAIASTLGKDTDETMTISYNDAEGHARTAELSFKVGEDNKATAANIAAAINADEKLSSIFKASSDEKGNLSIESLQNKYELKNDDACEITSIVFDSSDEAGEQTKQTTFGGAVGTAAAATAGTRTDAMGTSYVLDVTELTAGDTVTIDGVTYTYDDAKNNSTTTKPNTFGSAQDLIDLLGDDYSATLEYTATQTIISQPLGAAAPTTTTNTVTGTLKAANLSDKISTFQGNAAATNIGNAAFDPDAKFEGAGVLAYQGTTPDGNTNVNDKVTYSDAKLSLVITKNVKPEEATEATTTADPLNLSFQVGADTTAENKISVDIQSMSSKSLGIEGLKVDGKDSTNADAAVDTIAAAIQQVSTQRSALGAVQNRLEHTIANLDNVVENTTAAESQIRDTDMATEMVKFSNNNILAQAGQAMLAQANQANQGVLSLLG